ncbi:MAG: hypothetical protein JJT81_04435 [Rubellimicrobium sp.]|nr:hypothetical protein [Rubellimicrobium sp.]
MDGILYIATGEAFTRAANAAAASVRAQCPGLAIDIFTDSAGVLDPALFDRILPIEDPHRRSKVDYLPRTRFDRTLYLDTDTRIVADITEMFDILDRFDIAFAHAHARNKTTHVEHWTKPLPPAFPQLNGGVILYRRTPAVTAFLADWSRAYHTAGFGKDQTTLRELVWDSDLRPYILPPEYNIRYEKYLKVWTRDEASPKILHYRRFHDEHGAVEDARKLGGLRPLFRRLKGRVAGLKAKARAERAKVFCIGFHKTGTSSLSRALKSLGYRTIHGDSPASRPGGDEGRSLLKLIEAGDYDLPTFHDFDAFSDNPYFSIWRELDGRFPGARFILTLRDEDDWIDSCIRYYKDRPIRPMREWMFGPHADPSASPEARAAWLQAYRRHNAEVQAHFAGRPDFLVLDLAAGDGWDKLCPFLGLPVPARPFPHENRSAAAQGA